MSRRRRPSRYRYLRPLLWGFQPLIILILLFSIPDVLCRRLLVKPDCSPLVPWWVEYALFVSVVLSVAAAIRRYWLDFFGGEYARDCEDPNWRDI